MSSDSTVVASSLPAVTPMPAAQENFLHKVWDKIHGAGSSLLHALEAWLKKNDQAMINDGLKLLMPVVQDISAIIFDPHTPEGDTNRAAAVAEILTSAKQFGLSWGAKLLGDGEDAAKSWLSAAPTSDLQRYLAYARGSVQLIIQYGLKAMTAAGSHSTLDLIITTALKILSITTASA